jgi:hypothetical protein
MVTRSVGDPDTRICLVHDALGESMTPEREAIGAISRGGGYLAPVECLIGQQSGIILGIIVCGKYSAFHMDVGL